MPEGDNRPRPTSFILQPPRSTLSGRHLSRAASFYSRMLCRRPVAARHLPLPMNSAPVLRPLILLVEDDRDTREMYVVALGMLGFRVLEAGSAAAARAAARATQPD